MLYDYKNIMINKFIIPRRIIFRSTRENNFLYKKIK